MVIFDKFISNQITRKIKKKILTPYSMLSYEIHAFVTLFFPNGIWVRERISDIYLRSKVTKKYTQLYNLVYLPTAYDFSGLYATADIIQKDGEMWNIIEAFDVSEPTQEQIYDMAFKKYVFELAGYKINKSIIFCVRDNFVHKNLDNVFQKFDVTAQVDKVCQQFMESIYFHKNQEKSLYPQVTTAENAYIDYNGDVQKEKFENYEANDSYRLGQNNCRIVTKDNFYVFKLCLSFSPTVSVPEKHIKFLLFATHDINKVYIPCLNFEKSHHREMIKAFHRYEEDLLKLNDKLYEWKNYNSIPMPTIAFNQY